MRCTMQTADRARPGRSRALAFLARHAIVAGPLFNMTFMLYVLVTDVFLVGSYAWVSLGMPLGLTAAVAGLFLVMIFNVSRRWVRFIALAYGVFYIVIVSILPLPAGGNLANTLHNIIRLFVLSPWYVTWERSIVYGILAYASIACHGLTVAGVIACELPAGKQAFTRERLLAKRAPGRVLSSIFKTPQARNTLHALRHGKSAIALIATTAICATFVTANQLWFTTTFTMQYSADMLADLRLEYWLGVDEQFTNDSYPLINPPAMGYAAGDNASINISSTMALANPFHAAQVWVNVSFSNLSNVYFNMIPWGARLSAWTGSWRVPADNATLELVNITAGMAALLEAARTGPGSIHLVLEGYTASRLAALGTMNGAIVVAHRPDWTIYGNDQGEPVFYDPSAWDRVAWLFYTHGIQVQTVFGLDPFLMKFDHYAPRLRGIQKARLEGPWYWRAVLEGHMYNVERGGEERRAATEAYFWELYGWNLTAAYNNETYGIDKGLSDKNGFFQDTWAKNTMTEAIYAENAAKWAALFREMQVTVLPNGTHDETAYFKQINCGTMDSLIDLMDGDEDDAMFNHYLGSELPWDVAGYMFYRGNNQPYWTYGYTQLLAVKPPNHPREERMVYLGCMGLDCYSVDNYKETCIRARDDTMTAFTRDLNGDGRINGFDSLLFDIMMVRSTGVKRINLWPGNGPRSLSCCDYREFPRAMTSGVVNNNDTHDFFEQVAGILARNWTLEFDLVPGKEHYWDKHFTDIMMDLMRPKGLWVLAIFGAAFTLLVAYQRRWERRKETLLAAARR